MKGVTFTHPFHYSFIKNFNPHSHEGSDSWKENGLSGMENFNPHSHEGSDWEVAMITDEFREFQSTLPWREWRKEVGSANADLAFQSTLPWREWLQIRTIYYFYVHFNPHSHEGSDTSLPKYYIGQIISIHTPMKGVTLQRRKRKKRREFQSTLPWREWLCFLTHVLLPADFNPHSHEGSDYSTLQSFRVPEWFQSTLPWREWQLPLSFLLFFQHFNPHSHEGSDRKRIDTMLYYNISIHTPMKGVTCHTQHRYFWKIFQSTLPWREWRYLK